ncbi:hypothetical protein Dvina_48725 [Dactylosporangium vinaceum]|uniref:Uncharacterized protein n=1 Tax=Dactylosporangium vinaceum TaxID=53362 RepID=A0ABV5LYA4_9ACTN|nr:hypothetical protein [Dactylosporangium vinaceum]UAB95786.1 hypothetical protein Dvina_48725 [Dactylosporangium vinaceum]
MSTQPPDPTPSGGFQTPAAAQYQTPTQAVPVAAPAQQYQAVPQAVSAVPAPAVAPPDAKKARGLLEPYRELAAFGLLGAVGLILLAGLVRLLTGLFNSFLATATASFGNVIGFEVVLLPIVAVVLVLLLDPVTPRAKAVVLIAMIEYAIAAIIGLVLLLGGLIGDFKDDAPVGWALGGFLEHLAALGLIGLGLFLTARVYLGAYSAPKPVGAPYGQPGYPYQQGYTQQQQAYYAQQQQAAYAAAQAQQTGYVTGGQPAATPEQQAYYAQQQAAYAAQQAQAAQAAQATGSNPAVAAQTAYPPHSAQATQATPVVQQAAPDAPAAQATAAYATPGYAAPTTGGPTPGYATPTTGGPTPGYATPGYTAPAAAAPSFGAAATPAADSPASAADARPASGPPLSSPFAAYTAPAPTPVEDEPVSASPVETSASTPPGGFASAGWPGGQSTHPAPAAEEEGTAVLTPANTDADATQQAPIVKTDPEPAAEPGDPDATTVLKPEHKRGDDGEETQRTQAIPPGN